MKEEKGKTGQVNCVNKTGDSSSDTWNYPLHLKGCAHFDFIIGYTAEPEHAWNMWKLKGEFQGF